MPLPNQESNSGRRIRAALIAENASVVDVTQTIRASERFDVIAQAGMDRATATFDAEWFDDVRAPVAQSRVEAVLVATSTRRATMIARTAFKQGVHVWTLPPLGRSFAETIELAQSARAAGVTLQVYSWARHALPESLVAIARQPGFSELSVRVPAIPAGCWRRSTQEAGGGVLMHECHPWLEAVYRFRGLPEWTQCVLSHARGGHPDNETEEVGVLLMRYQDGNILHAHAARGVTSQCSAMYMHGPGTDTLLSPDRVSVFDLDGDLQEQQLFPAHPRALDLVEFAQRVAAEPQDPKASQALDSHVAASAIVEAAYLSSRTGQLESPSKMYEVHKWPLPAL